MALLISYLSSQVIINLLNKRNDRPLTLICKLVGIVSSESEVQQLRLDLKRLYHWSLDCQMLFNVGQCKSLHFGYRNANSLCIFIAIYCDHKIMLCMLACVVFDLVWSCSATIVSPL